MVYNLTMEEINEHKEPEQKIETEKQTKQLNKGVLDRGVLIYYSIAVIILFVIWIWYFVF